MITRDISLSEIGFGCGGIWGMRAFPEDRAVALVRRAVELGINFFDTGPTYSGDNAEPRLGRALSTVDGEIAVGTKLGTHRGTRGRLYKDYTPSALRKSLEASLLRLGRERVDVLSLHGPLHVDQVTDELVGVMSAFREEGKAALIGASCDGPVAQAVIAAGIFDVVMTTYNVATPEAEPLLRAAERANMKVLVKTPLAHNVFSDRLLRLDRPSQIWYLAKLLRNDRKLLARRRSFAFLNHIEGRTAQEAALRYVLDDPAVACAVVGTVRPEHLEADAGAASAPRLPAELTGQIRAASQGRNMQR